MKVGQDASPISRSNQSLYGTLADFFNCFRSPCTANIELSNAIRAKQTHLGVVKSNVVSLESQLAHHDGQRPHSKMSSRKKQELDERVQVYQRKLEVEKSKNTQLTLTLAAVKEVSY